MSFKKISKLSLFMTVRAFQRYTVVVDKLTILVSADFDNDSYKTKRTMIRGCRATKQVAFLSRNSETVQRKVYPKTYRTNKSLPWNMSRHLDKDFQTKVTTARSGSSGSQGHASTNGHEFVSEYWST